MDRNRMEPPGLDPGSYDHGNGYYDLENSINEALQPMDDSTVALHPPDDSSSESSIGYVSARSSTMDVSMQDTTMDVSIMSDLNNTMTTLLGESTLLGEMIDKPMNIVDTSILPNHNVMEKHLSTSNKSHFQQTTIIQSIQFNIDVTVQKPLKKKSKWKSPLLLCSYLKSNCKSRKCNIKNGAKIRKCTTFFTYLIIGLLMIKLGIFFDMWVRFMATSALDYYLEPVTEVISSPYRFRRSVSSIMPVIPDITPWLIGLEISVSLQPYQLPKKGTPGEAVRTNESVVLSLIIEDEDKLRLYMDRSKSSKESFNLRFRNINAPRIIVSHFVNEYVTYNVKDDYGKELLFNIIMSKTNISKKALPLQSLQEIVNDLRVAENFADHVPNELDRYTMQNITNFVLENQDMTKSLIYQGGSLYLKSCKRPPASKFVYDYESIFKLPSKYALPGTDIEFDNLGRTTWMGLNIVKYALSTIPRFILRDINKELMDIPLHVTNPFNDLNVKPMKIVTSPNIDISNTEYETLEEKVSFKERAVSLNIHSILGIPISGSASFEVAIRVPDDPIYGSLRKERVPYMLLSISVTKLPAWLLDAFHVFMYFRLGFIIIFIISGAILIAFSFSILAIMKPQKPKEGQLIVSDVESEYNSLNGPIPKNKDETFDCVDVGISKPVRRHYKETTI